MTQSRRSRQSRERCRWFSLLCRLSLCLCLLPRAILPALCERRLGHTRIDTTGRYFAQLHSGNHPPCDEKDRAERAPHAPPDDPTRVHAPLSEIQRRLGHSNIATTSRYMSRLRTEENPYGADVVRRLGLRRATHHPDAENTPED
jgi:hypothetical protein